MEVVTMEILAIMVLEHGMTINIMIRVFMFMAVDPQ